MTTIRIDAARIDDARLVLAAIRIGTADAAGGLSVQADEADRALRALDREGIDAVRADAITRIDADTYEHAETGARIHRTPRGWWVAVATGPQPTDAVRVGEGDTREQAVEALSRTAVQSVGRDCGEADALEWVSHQSGAGFRLAVDGDGWTLEDAP